MRVGFVLRRDKPEAEALARELIPWMQEDGHAIHVLPRNGELGDGLSVVAEEELGAAIDLCVILGGDGTLLRGSGFVSDHGVPILGINLGTLGFLVPFAPSEAREAIGAALNGALPLEERMRLAVRLVHRDPTKPGLQRSAVNDAVLAQGTMARLVELDATLDGALITRYRADGLIVCTPTGSTAYNLAAGGPILTPGHDSVAITPICPHTLTHRPVVVPASSRIEVTLGRAAREVHLTVDGQWGHPVEEGDTVEISRAARPLRLYHSKKAYFEILQEKLFWGVR